jgi:hypothetical protein
MASPVRDPLAVIKVKKIPRHNELIPAPTYRSMVSRGEGQIRYATDRL